MAWGVVAVLAVAAALAAFHRVTPSEGEGGYLVKDGVAYAVVAWAVLSICGAAFLVGESGIFALFFVPPSLLVICLAGNVIVGATEWRRGSWRGARRSAAYLIVLDVPTCGATALLVPTKHHAVFLVLVLITTLQAVLATAAGCRARALRRRPLVPR